jgi:hypothetical protein
MQGKITLPEDLTRREAERIADFVAAFAFDDEGSDTTIKGPLAATGVVHIIDPAS